MKRAVYVMIIANSLFLLFVSCQKSKVTQETTNEIGMNAVSTINGSKQYSVRVYAGGPQHTTLYYDTENSKGNVLVHDDRITFGVFGISQDGRWAYVSMISHMNVSPPIQETDALVFLPKKEVLRPQLLGIGAGPGVQSFTNKEIQFNPANSSVGTKLISVSISQLETLTVSHPAALIQINKEYLDKVWNITAP